MDKFFANNTYVIDEKITVIENSYAVSDSEGNAIGRIQEHVPAYRFLLSMIINKSMMPFSLTIENTGGSTLATISRGWTFFLSKMTITNEAGDVIAYIKQKFSLLKPKFTILDADQQVIGYIKGDWMAWDFHITDSEENELGTISKKWNGILKEAFTTADKYIVNINPSVADENQRIALVSTAATIDMILKENK